MNDPNQMTAQAVLIPGAQPDPNLSTMRLALFDQNGDPIELPGSSSTPTGDDVLLTGYVDGSAGTVTAADTLNEALAKLQARVDALERA